jgi:type VI secretion system secreted protein VgrG
MSDSSSQNATPSDSGDDFYVTVDVTPDPGVTFVFDGLTANEELGRPFLITLDLSCGQVVANMGSLLGSSVTVTMTGSDKTTKTYFNGILTRISYTGISGGVYSYHVELRPWIWLLTRAQDCKIFQNMSAWDIIQKVVSDAGFSGMQQDKRQNSAGSTPVLKYCVQYDETAHDFITRLMEQFGIYYFFTHDNGKHTLVFADDTGSHTSIGELPFDVTQVEHRAVADHVFEWSADMHLQSGAFTFRDYDFTTPAADLTSKSLQPGPGQSQYSKFEVYEYPGRYYDPSVGSTLAGLRMQEIAARAQLFDGRSNSRSLRSGTLFTLTGFAESSAMNQAYLVTHATTTLTIVEGTSDQRGNLIDSQRVTFTAMPSSVPFKLEPRTPRPMIRGPQTALVVGEAGDEITTDQYGRIKVQFYWDRVGTKDQNSSCWIRVAQNWGGAGWGGIVIPRIGMEVVVTFIEGNPDRPLVTGVVYNATQTVPNTLPDKKVLSTFRTNSSKGGGGFNEFTFDDTKGNELVFFQAQYNYSKKVLNNETVEITQDTTTTVDKGNRSVTVSTGNDSHTVSQGNRSVTVSQGNDSHTVSQGNQSLTVSAGNQTVAISAGSSKTTTGQNFEVTASAEVQLTATSSITLTCGASSIKISPSGITMSGPQIQGTAQGSMSLDGGASMTLKAGMISIN